MLQRMKQFYRDDLCGRAKQLQKYDFISLLAIRWYLVPIFWMAGMQKLLHIQATAEWFGNSDWGLGLPYPLALTYIAGISEVLGAVLLLIGLGVRLISIPLMVIMLMAALTVHLENGWLAIASEHSDAAERLSEFMQWLQLYFPKRHDFITHLGNPVILNNGVEFSVTYFIMLLSLFFSGAGKYLSIDYWLEWGVNRKKISAD
jgi:putative oxidoreductase